MESLHPGEWFFEGHGLTGGSRNRDGMWIPTSCEEGAFLWAPPPGAADVAVEELATARHKRESLHHIFVCPRLMTHLWRKRVYKLADCVWEIPAGSREFWPKEMHEPLIIAVILPFVKFFPWQLRGSQPVLELAGRLRGVWKDGEEDERIILRQLWILPGYLEAMPASMVWGLLHPPPKRSISLSQTSG